MQVAPERAVPNDGYAVVEPAPECSAPRPVIHFDHMLDRQPPPWESLRDPSQGAQPGVPIDGVAACNLLRGLASRRASTGSREGSD